VARRAREREELVHLGVEAGLAALQDDLEAVRPAPRRGARDLPGRVAAALHAQHDLVVRVLERGEQRQVVPQPVVHAAERLQDRDGRPPGGGRRRRGEVSPQGQALRRHQREPEGREGEEDDGELVGHVVLRRRARPAPCGQRAMIA